MSPTRPKATDDTGEPSRDRPAPTPPRAADPPSDDRPENAAGFSETKELVLSMNSMKFMLDLDTGETMDPPATAGRPEQAKMDLSTTQVQPYHYPTGLVGHSLQGKEVKPGDWNATTSDVRRALADNIYPLKEMDVGPEENPTYFFKTRDGALGILQLLGVTDEPKGVRLRYKTVLTGSNAKKSAPQNESLAKIQGDWIVEKMTFGQEDALGMAADRRYQITVKDDSLTLLYRLVNKPETLSTTPMRVDRIDNTSAVIVPLGIASYEPRMPALLECDGRTLRLCWRLSSGKGGVFVPPPALAPAENVVYYECRRRTEDDFNLAPGSAEQPPQPIAPSTAPKPAQDTPQSLDKASAIELRLAYSQPGDGLVEMAIAGGDEKVYVAQDTIATDAGIANAEVIDDSAGQAVIQFTFKDEAAKHLRAATGQHRDKPLAILVNGNMLAAPIVRDAIGGKALISGKFSREEAQRIVTLVNSLPQEARRFHTREGVHRIAASADGKLIAVANGNPTFILQADGTSRVKDNWKPQVEILDANTGASVRVISPVFSPTVSAVLEATRRVNHIEVTALAFSPVEEVIAVGTSIGQVLLFNSRTGMLLNSLDDKEPRLADKETPEIWKPLQRAMGSVASISFSPDGSLLAVCGNSFEDFSDVFDGIEQLRRRSTAPGRLKVFAVKTGALKHDLAGHSHAFDVAFSTDGSLLASAGRWDGGNDPGNGVLVWNPQSGEKMRTILIEANGGTHRVAFSPNQKLIATGSELYDKEKDTSSTSIAVMYPLSGSREWQRVVPGWSKLEFVPDGTALAVLSGGQSIQYLDVRTGQTKQVPTAPFAPPGARFNDFAVAHKGRKLAVGGIDANRRGLVFVWPTGEGSAASP
jgi:WD40 repeat protein